MKKILALVFVIMMIMLAGCAKTEKTDDKQLKPNQEELINQYQVMIDENKPARELAAFIEMNKTGLSRENMDKAVIGLVEVQQARLKDYEDKMFSPEINIPLNSYKYEDLLLLRNIKEEEIKNLLQDAFSNGYKLSASEGMYYPEIDYDKIHKDFGGHASDKVAGYLEIMAAESNKHFASDAALIISPDELANRIVKAEKFIGSYPDFVLIQQVKQFHNYYLTAYLLGLNNTPLFDYQTEKAKNSFIKSYENTINSQKGTKLAGLLEEYTALLKKYDYKKSDEIMNFVDRATAGK
ncbi:hypothetical protein ACOBQJ_11020 [Pelotomaculum propionicicum]|uniref:hypothetical protein n=1 Tax=Pelotomaculum propionicicum TaxID=258475 RepID=UPI003B7E9699